MEHQDAIDRFHKESEETVNRESKRIMEIVLKSNYYKYQTTNINKEARLIVEKIKSNNKFIVTQISGRTEWEITKNPSYKNEFGFSLLNILLTGVISLIVSISTLEYQSSKEQQELILLKLKLEMVARKLDSSLHTKK